ncbi:MAG: hypothetical protein D6732_29540 [Methanobacteriota archaeon]|nr:MAG: hypothetical protein D6732_29540 [Euryarchaeota archaeon]
MNGIPILIITEGATEREVGKVLWERGVLSQVGIPKPPNWKSMIGSREGYEQVINALAKDNPIAPFVNDEQCTRVLLIFDCEDSPSPSARKAKIENDLKSKDESGFWNAVSFNPVSDFDNLFEFKSDNLHLVCVISAPNVDGISNRLDFDGYIIQLLQGQASQEIAQKLVEQSQHHNVADLLRKAKDELTELMNRNGYPWTHSKSWLYAYITVFQYRQSHVWFAKRIVEQAPEEELHRVFAPLTTAWTRLLTGGI